MESSGKSEVSAEFVESELEKATESVDIGTNVIDVDSAQLGDQLEPESQSVVEAKELSEKSMEKSHEKSDSPLKDSMEIADKGEQGISDEIDSEKEKNDTLTENRSLEDISNESKLETPESSEPQKEKVSDIPSCEETPKEEADMLVEQDQESHNPIVMNDLVLQSSECKEPTEPSELSITGIIDASIDKLVGLAVNDDDEKMEESDIEETASISMDTDQGTSTGDGEKDPVTDTLAAHSSATDARRDLQVKEDTPEKLVSLLKLLTPEKLEEIKSQIITSVKEFSGSEKVEEVMDLECNETIVKVEPDLDPLSNRAEATASSAEAAPSSDDCIILLDSDDDEESSSAIPSAVIPSNVETVISDSSQKPNEKRKSDEMKENRNKMQKRITECINPDCSKESNDFLKCDRFIVSFFFAFKRENQRQHVCRLCYDKVIQKYEEMGEALLNGDPLFNLRLSKKPDMIEVIDSDDEIDLDDTTEIPDSEKIRFNADDEKLAEEILQSLATKVNIRQQVKWDHEEFKKRCEKVDKEHLQLEHSLRLLDRKSTKMYNDLYAINKPRSESIQPLDIIEDDGNHRVIRPLQSANASFKLTAAVQAAVENIQKNSSIVIRASNELPTASKTSPSSKVVPIPGQKIVIFPPKTTAPQLHPNAFYANRLPNIDRMQSWSPCMKLEANSETKTFKVKFFGALNEVVEVSGKNFAVNTVNDKLKIGTRVIAQVRESSHNKISKFFPGVIGEKMSSFNNYRYLVFCDYGQVQYVKPEGVREVADVSPNVWDDVHPNLRTFIREYLMKHSQGQRALLNVKLNQFVKTERNGAFRFAQVVEIDCSIMRMLFVNDGGAQEWLYRGSKRLQPIFNQESIRSLNTNTRRINPNISYSAVEEEEPKQSEASRNIAKKSTSGKVQAVNRLKPLGKSVVILNDKQIYLDEPKQVSKLKHFAPKASIKAKKYVPHECSPACLPPMTNSLANYSPLSKPLLSCWERQIVRQKSSRMVMYKAPCGRRLRDFYELRDYLLMTESPLNVDNFDYDALIQVLSHYEVIDKSLCPLYIADITEGKERMKIPAINAFDNQAPPPLEYSNICLPQEGVYINKDPAFMACCDCTDDCADKTKCACFQLTLQGYRTANIGTDYDEGDVSYKWKRLPHGVNTGIYECHSGCPCTSRCLNRVVQEPIQIKMQLFRTKDRGWGLQCNHDIPKGTFICTYVGRLYGLDDANARASQSEHGDNYYAELDFIETADSAKEGYEPDVDFGSDSEEESERSSDSDYDHSQDNDASFVASAPKNCSGRAIITRSTGGGRNRNPVQRKRDSKDSDSEGEIVSMEPSVEPSTKGRLRVRRLYGKNEKPYVMDASTCGNIGRYFNHSCEPNLYVQSVFVDTHDMRFPWIAFFAGSLIKAGDELTWNYNYEVATVPDKALYCKCGAKTCRGRVL